MQFSRDFYLYKKESFFFHIIFCRKIINKKVLLRKQNLFLSVIIPHILFPIQRIVEKLQNFTFHALFTCKTI